jgi:hypothetical protein
VRATRPLTPEQVAAGLDTLAELLGETWAQPLGQHPRSWAQPRSRHGPRDSTSSRPDSRRRGPSPHRWRAWEDYRRATVYGFLCWLCNPDTWQPPDVNVATFARFGTATLDHDTYAALGV